MNLANTDDKTGIASPSGKEDNLSFREQYVALRRKEQRVYADIEVANLPATFEENKHASEWVIRRQSCSRLVKYLKTKKRPEILEVGCGNGWLSNRLSQIQGSTVTGIDINELELQQAKRVFAGQSNLSFVYGDLYDIKGHFDLFDIIVFAASIQYFESFSETISIALKKLNAGGEVHILDSPFYAPTDIDPARERTKKYFAETGFREMENYYFHHSIESLNGFNQYILYNPHSLKNKLLRNRNPFPWIRITKEV